MKLWDRWIFQLSEACLAPKWSQERESSCEMTPIKSETRYQNGPLHSAPGLFLYYFMLHLVKFQFEMQCEKNTNMQASITRSKAQRIFLF